MSNEQRQKIQCHLRAIGDVLTEIGDGDYSVLVQKSYTATIGGPVGSSSYALEMTVHSEEIIK